MDWKILGIMALVLYGLSTILISSNYSTGNRTTPLVCTARYTGRTCNLCTFPMYGFKCIRGNWIGTTTALHTEKVRVAFLTGGVSATEQGVTEKLEILKEALLKQPLVSEVVIHTYTNNLAEELKEERVSFVVPVYYDVRLESVLENTETSVVKLPWVVHNNTALYLWKSLGTLVDGYLSSSEKLLENMGKNRPVRALNLPSTKHCCRQQTSANVTFYGDHSEDAQYISDEIKHFGATELTTTCLPRTAFTVSYQPNLFFQDAAPLLAFDSSLCDSLYITSPHSPHQLPLRHLAPHSHYPQSFFDLRLAISSSLSNPSQRASDLRLLKEVAKRELSPTVVAQTLIDTYFVLKELK
eukprot:TRINITY_DN1072_c2_g2_i1.p1 TRINITY_DN1072_c2_g2~~TRINITY_DN1072_c2_g2_i1.p1  ORF type:complete len:355 (+),score=43.12 TRINITY_DN1072_c2_g2_i1:44-1108(+)